MAGTGQHTVLIFVIGAVVGVLLGWWAARALSAPASDDSPTLGSRATGAIGTFLKNAALIALVVVVFILLANSIVHSPPHH